MSNPTDRYVHVKRPRIQQTLFSQHEFIYRTDFEEWLEEWLKAEKEEEARRLEAAVEQAKQKADSHSLAVYAGERAAKESMQDTAKLKDEEINRLRELLREKGTQSEGQTAAFIALQDKAKEFQVELRLQKEQNQQLLDRLAPPEVGSKRQRGAED